MGSTKKFPVPLLPLLFVWAFPNAVIAQQIGWPVQAPRITQDYGCRDCAKPGYHSGIDFTDASRQSCATALPPPVLAAADGTVYRTVYGCTADDAPCGRGYGNHVVLFHPSGLYTFYAHLKVVDVQTDQEVSKGQPLGDMGATGDVTACHVHFAILDFPPGPSGDFPNLQVSSGVEAYPAVHPSAGCGSSASETCIDPKDHVPQNGFTLGGAASFVVNERPDSISDCVGAVKSGQSFVALGPPFDGWSFITLPTQQGLDAPTGSISGCQSEAAFGWHPAPEEAPTSGFKIEANGSALQGAGLSVRDAPGGNLLTFIWGGQAFWATGQVSPPSGACDELWYEFFVPSSRTQGLGRAWACGDYLDVDAGSCPASVVEKNGVLLLKSCTPATPPSITTLAATSITEGSATLNLNANAHGSPTIVWFRWGTTSDSLPQSTPSLDVGSGSSVVARSSTLISLSCDTQYFFQAWADGSGDPVYGDILSFRTTACGDDGGDETTNLIEDSGFEAGNAGWWVAEPDLYISDDFPGRQRSGSYYAYLSDSFGNPGNGLEGGMITPIMTIPSNAESAELRFWHSISTQETTSTSKFDELEVYVVGSNNQLFLVAELSNLDHSGTTYLETRRFLSSSFFGEDVQLFFRGATDGILPTVFRIDDVSLWVTVPTAQEPSVATLSADQIGSSSARLNMEVNPNASPTEVWFDLEAGDSTPNDDTPHFTIGAGTETEIVSYTAPGLDCETRYYFEANASNTEGSNHGTVRSFTTGSCPGSPPFADTDPADSITETSARLTAEVNPNGLPTDAWFEWGPSTSLGATTPQQNIPAGTAYIDVTQGLSGLTCDTTYYFRVVAENSKGDDNGAIHSFTTSACSGGGSPPAVATLAAGSITETSARLTGQVNPSGLSSEAWFAWGTSTSLGKTTLRQGIPAGTNYVGVDDDLTGLTCNTTYYFRIMAENSGGSDSGEILNFRTAACSGGTPPSVETLSPSSVTETSAQFIVRVNPNGLWTEAWFDWGSTPDLGSVTERIDVGPGTEFYNIPEFIVGLNCGSTYYVRGIAANEDGTVQGAVVPFVTDQCTPEEIPPTISLDPPEQHGFFPSEWIITWSSTDPDSDAVIRLYYSLSPSCSSPTLFSPTLIEDWDYGSFTWNTAGLPADDYYVLAVIDDGFSQASSCSSTPVVVEPGLVTVFTDSFETGSLQAWTNRYPSDGLGLFVNSAAASVGDLGLDIQVDACSAVADLVVPDQIVFGAETFVGCNTVSAYDVDLQEGSDVSMSAGSKVILGDGFSVARNAHLRIAAGASAKVRYLQDDTPANLSSYFSEFTFDASDLTVEVGSQFDLLVAYNAQGKPIFRVTVWYDETKESLVGAVFVAAYDYVTWWRSGALDLSPGPHYLQAGWYSATPEEAGRGNFGRFNIRRGTGGTTFQYLYLEDAIESVRWGVLNASGDISGSLKLDNFRSWTAVD